MKARSERSMLRANLLDASGLRQLTRDHSLVQWLVEIGQITPEEAHHHEHKNVITRSLGARQSGPAGTEAVALRLKRDDREMLCSDGLTAHVDDKTIGEVLRRHDDPYAATRELVVAANAGGGTDNVSEFTSLRQSVLIFGILQRNERKIAAFAGLRLAGVIVRFITHR
jgi:serine/threonine protein phosphatase PrpC